MAEATISFAVETLGNLVIKKVHFLGGVEGEVESVKCELQRMQGFLKDAAEKQANDENIRQWISEIRELAQDAEDVIETWVLKVENPRTTRGLLGKCACFPSHLYHLDELGNEIKFIKARLEEIEISRRRYKIENIQGSSRRSYAAQRRMLSPWQRDKQLVGLDENVKLLLKRAILEETKGLSVASIVGLPGIGKSTLARVVYNHAEVARRFERRAWVIASEQFNLSETVKELVLQLLEPNEDEGKVLENMKNSPEQYLKRMLHDRLKGRRYFIVVDDVWRPQDWESLATSFPDEQDTTSRLLITSRSRNIPSGAQYVHEMKILDNYKSWELLLKTTFNDSTNIGTCPPELVDIGEKILTKCNGLPLAITVVGGLLLEKRQSRNGWEKVLQDINSHLGSSNSNIRAILELSYHDLPPHLKPCFLCLGFFEEDATIRVDKLVHYWIAQGLIPHESGIIMEDTSISYLDELINRNMVQVTNLSKTSDRVKSCQMHDLFRDLSIIKAKEEINFEILKDQGNSTPQPLSPKPRHCAIYCSTESFNTLSTRSVHKHLRSLFFHGGRGCDVDCILSYKWKNFKLLKILNMEGLELKKLPDTIGGLVGLKFLGLKRNSLHELPSSLRRLKNLQVLDISKNLLSEWNDIWKMVSLRHLYASMLYCRVPLEMENLKNIQTLQSICADKRIIKHLTRMTSLRKLGISITKDFDVNEFYTALATLKNLFYLSFLFCYVQSLEGIVSLRHLTTLKVFGSLTKLPHASNFPPNLSSLILDDTELKEDPMPTLEKLPKLLYLKLGYQAYSGEEMLISHEGFPCLKVFHLDKIRNLRNMKVKKGGIPELEKLEISECPDLKRLPKELKFMSNLRELKVHTFNASEFRDVNSHIISNIPFVTVEDFN